MTCRNCQSFVADGRLLCPTCVQAQSHKALLALQGDFLPAAVKGNPPFRLVRRVGREEWHIEMLGFKGQGFCGALFANPPKQRLWEGRKEKVPYLKLDKECLCADCWQTLAEKVKEIALAGVA